MRDVRTFVKTESLTRSDYNPMTQKWNHYTTYANRTLAKSERDDAVSTLPSPTGQYYRPTGYGSFHSTITAHPFEFSFKNTLFTAWTSDDTTTVVKGTGRSADDCYRLGCNNLFRPELPGWVVSRARNSLIEQIKNSDFNASLFLGESREAGQLLAPLFNEVNKRTDRFNRDVEKVRRSRAYNRASDATRRKIERAIVAEGVGRVYEGLRSSAFGKGLAAVYLTYMYGIRPLMQDIWEILKGLEFTAKTMPAKVIRSRVLDTSFTTASWSGRTSTKWLEGKLERGIHNEVTYRIINPGVFDASRYGLTSPLSLAWELVTLSFVADWFIGLGAFLNGIEQPLGVQQSTYFETWFVDNSFTRVEDLYTAAYKTPTTYAHSGGLCRTSVRTKSMARFPAPSVLPPPPYLHVGAAFKHLPALLALTVARM